jgi:hypothetical protein
MSYEFFFGLPPLRFGGITGSGSGSVSGTGLCFQCVPDMLSDGAVVGGGGDVVDLVMLLDFVLVGVHSGFGGSAKDAEAPFSNGDRAQSFRWLDGQGHRSSLE